jgi:hypothetical protein
MERLTQKQLLSKSFYNPRNCRLVTNAVLLDEKTSVLHRLWVLDREHPENGIPCLECRCKRSRRHCQEGAIVKPYNPLTVSFWYYRGNRTIDILQNNTNWSIKQWMLYKANFSFMNKWLLGRKSKFLRENQLFHRTGWWILITLLQIHVLENGAYVLIVWSV